MKKFRMISISLVLFLCALSFTSVGGFGCGADDIGRAVGESLTGIIFSMSCPSPEENEVTDENRGDVSDHFVRCCKLRADTEVWADKDETDSDGDGLVNICDPAIDDADFDEDGVEDGPDNCPLTPNPGQEYSNEEGEEISMEEYRLGEACPI